MHVKAHSFNSHCFKKLWKKTKDAACEVEKRYNQYFYKATRKKADKSQRQIIFNLPQSWPKPPASRLAVVRTSNHIQLHPCLGRQVHKVCNIIGTLYDQKFFGCPVQLPSGKISTNDQVQPNPPQDTIFPCCCHSGCYGNALRIDLIIILLVRIIISARPKPAFMLHNISYIFLINVKVLCWNRNWEMISSFILAYALYISPVIFCLILLLTLYLYHLLINHRLNVMFPSQKCIWDTCSSAHIPESKGFLLN